jgi:hypothetical protein
MKEHKPHEDPTVLPELMSRRMSRRDLLKVAGAGAGVVALGPLLAACGSSSSSSGASASPAKGSSTPIKFVFSADPVWNWLEDKGIVAEMESASGYHIARNETEDEFAFFAGGHADIVSMGSYEVPVLEKETGVRTVTFAKYNKGKDMLCVDPAKGYNSFADLPSPGKVGLESATNSAHAWIALAKSEGRDLGAKSDELQIVITDFSVAPELVLRERRQVPDGQESQDHVRRQGDLADLRVEFRTGARRLRQQQLRVYQDVLRRAPRRGRLLRERLGAGRQGVLGQHAGDRQAVPQRLRLADPG